MRTLNLIWRYFLQYTKVRLAYRADFVAAWPVSPPFG